MIDFFPPPDLIIKTNKERERVCVCERACLCIKILNNKVIEKVKKETNTKQDITRRYTQKESLNKRRERNIRRG